jgi:uncharacterized OsmC-like protein
MLVSTIRYLGQLRTEATHLKSGQKFVTDAPVDNQGKGEAFSPTDLLATALGSCAITIAGIAARTHGFNIDGTLININKIMADNPRRVASVEVEFVFPPVEYSARERKIIENAVKTCPVSCSLDPALNQVFTFKYTV